MLGAIKLPYHAKVIGGALLAPPLLLGIGQLVTWSHSSAIESAMGLLMLLPTLALWPAAIGLMDVPKGELGKAWPLVCLLIGLNVPWFYLLVGIGRGLRKLRRRGRPDAPVEHEGRR